MKLIGFSGPQTLCQMDALGVKRLVSSKQKNQLDYVDESCLEFNYI